jgi:DNA-binding response OmpR family regulator
VSHNILIIDDEPRICDTLVQALEPAGHHIFTALTGSAGLAVANERPLDLVLLDLRLPDMDGLEVLRRLIDQHPAIRVIILTAHGSVPNAVEAMKLGAVDFVQKPMSLRSIREVVERTLVASPEPTVSPVTYDTCIARARSAILQRDLNAARDHVRHAIGLDTNRPEAFNLLGVLDELAGDRVSAQRNFRVALDLNPEYAAAEANLKRSTSAPAKRGALRLDG